MRADPWAIGALSICSFAWLLTAAVLTLDLLGRLPRARKRNARAFRLQQTAGLVLMTTVVLSQVGALAHWARPMREAVEILAILAGISTLAAVGIAATIQSKARRTQAASDASRPASPPG
jgi:hypothetical protein